MADATGGPPRGGSTRINVSVPVELLDRARELNPNLSPSALLQEALRTAIGCEHEALVCARCDKPIRRLEIVDQALSHFYADVQAIVADHARRGGTVEGVGRRVKELGQSHQLRIASELPAPGLTRAERQAAKVKDLPPAAPTRQRAPLAAVDPSAVEAG